MHKSTISELPDQILLCIVSFLPIEEVFRNCRFLSKRWKRICDMLPCVDFSEIFVARDFPDIKVLNFVGKYLLMRQSNKKIGIDSFKLNLPCYDSQLTSHMNTWFQTLSRCNIREITFSISFINRDRRYNFPKEILSSESLFILDLSGCNFELAEEDCVDIKSGSLKCLSLSYVALSDGSLKRLIKSCVSLLYLDINHCDGFSNLKVEGLPRLRELSLILNRNLKRVEIDEPSLFYLDYNGGYIYHDDIKFSNCVNLIKLSLTHSDITGEQLSEQLLPLQNLRGLFVISCSKITSLNISADSLRKLYVEHDEQLSVANIIAPRLQYLYLTSRYFSSSTKMSSLSIDIALPTLQVKYGLVPKVLGANMFIELLKFLTSFRGSQLTLATSIENAIVPRGWSKHFSRMRSLAQFQNFWADPEARLLDVLRSINQITVMRVNGSMVKILEDEPIEVYDDAEL